MRFPYCAKVARLYGKYFDILCFLLLCFGRNLLEERFSDCIFELITLTGKRLLSPTLQCVRVIKTEVYY